MISPRLSVVVLAVALAAGVAEARDRPFLWKAESARATAYLLGSIHVARPDFYPLHSRIEEAFDRSATLVVEADPTGEGGLAAAGLIMTLGTYPDGDDLANHIPAPLLEATGARFARYGIPAAAWRRFEPWLAAMTITMTELSLLGMSATLGIDVHFLERARGKKEIVELEGVEEQIRLLDGFGKDEQRLFLEYTLRDVEQISEHVEEMVTAWKKGDAKRLEMLLFGPARNARELAPIHRKLFDERNRKMADAIASRLEGEGTSFVVVGAGHLVGDQGIVHLLADRYTVTQAAP